MITLLVNAGFTASSACSLTIVTDGTQCLLPISVPPCPRSQGVSGSVWQPLPGTGVQGFSKSVGLCDWSHELPQFGVPPPLLPLVVGVGLLLGAALPTAVTVSPSPAMVSARPRIFRV